MMRRRDGSMAFRVDIDREMLLEALNFQLSSKKRAFNTAKQQVFKPIYEKQVTDLMVAIASIEEIKELPKAK